MLQIAVYIDGALVAVDAHRHARSDGVGLLRQAHRQARALGQEVAAVGGRRIDRRRNDIASDLHVCLMAGDVQADRCGYLELLLLSLH